MTGWHQHIDDLAGAVAALLTDCSVRTSPLTDAAATGLLQGWLTLHLWDEVLQEGCQRAQEVSAGVQA